MPAFAFGWSPALLANNPLHHLPGYPPIYSKTVSAFYPSGHIIKRNIFVDVYPVHFSVRPCHKTIQVMLLHDSKISFLILHLFFYSQVLWIFFFCRSYTMIFFRQQLPSNILLHFQVFWSHHTSYGNLYSPFTLNLCSNPLYRGNFGQLCFAIRKMLNLLLELQAPIKSKVVITFQFKGQYMYCGS